MVRDADNEGGDTGGGQGRQRHVGEEGSAREVQVTEDDEVGQVRSGQQQRPRVGEQQAGVEQRSFTLATTSGRVDEHGREERDRRIEVQERGHTDDEHHGPEVEQEPVGGQAGKGVTAGREQPVPVGDEADQQEPRDKDEGRPVLGRGGAGMVRREQHCRDDERASADRRAPAQRDARGRRALPRRVGVHGRSVPGGAGVKPRYPEAAGGARQDPATQRQDVTKLSTIPVASRPRATGPTMRAGRYCAPPGQVWPPPTIR